MPMRHHADNGLSTVVADRAVRNLFGAALDRDVALRDLFERGLFAARFFAPLLEDLFCVFYSKSATLAEGGHSDRLQQLLIEYVLSDADYRAIRARTAGDYARTVTATEEFGVMLIEFLATTAAAGGVNSKHGASEFMRITGLKFVEETVVGDGQPPSEGMLALAKRIEGALDATQILTDVCHSYGLQPGAIRDLPYDQRADIAARLAQSTNVKRLAELLGRFAAVAQARQEKRLTNLPEEVRDVTLGDDWARFVPHEYVWLVHPSLRLDFYRRLVDRQILQYEPESRERQGRGAIVVCIDTSGSMAGDRDIRAKATALALLKLARAAGRPYAAILFSSRDQWISFAFDDSTVVSRHSGPGGDRCLGALEGIVCVGVSFFGGGTDYETPLGEAVRLIGKGGRAWHDADIVFITDDYCEVTDVFLEDFLAQKKSLEFSVYSIIIGAPAEHARTLAKFSDEVIASASLDETVAAQVFDALR